MGILPSYSHVITIVWSHHLDSDKTIGEKARQELHKDAAYCFEQIQEAALRKNSSCMAAYLSPHKPSR